MSDLEIHLASRATLRSTREIARELLVKVIEEFTYENPDHAKFMALGLRGRPPDKTITTAKAPTKFAVSVPLGGADRLAALVGGDVPIVDERTKGEQPIGIPPHGVKLWEFQERMVEHAMREEVCCLRAPPAAGKTTAALALASRLNLPTLVVVWTEALLKQWVDRCVVELGMDRDDVGIIQGKTRRLRPITIGMQQTLWKCAAQYGDRFGLVICDELQRFAASSFFSVIDVMQARYRIGVSADERRADRKEFLIYDAFGKMAFEVGREELEQSGRIVDVQIIVVPTRFDAPWYRELVAKVQRGALKANRLAKEWNRLLDEMTHDEDRNRLIASIAARHVDADRIVVALSHRREHCVLLSAEFDRATNGRGGILLGGTESSDEYDRAKRGLIEGRVRAAAATYQAFGTGMDVPALDVGMFTTPVANSANGRMQFDQFRGRFARAHSGKSEAIAYYFWDRQVFGAKPLRHLSAWCKTVRVRDGLELVDVRQFMKGIRDEKAERHSADPTDGIFVDGRGGNSPATGTLKLRSSVRR